MRSALERGEKNLEAARDAATETLTGQEAEMKSRQEGGVAHVALEGGEEAGRGQ